MVETAFIGQFSALGAIQGNTPEDPSTMYFISQLIDDSHLDISDDELLYDYGLKKGYTDNET